MLATLPWDLAADLPWRVLRSPLEQWAALPSFVVGELSFFALAAISGWHARRAGREARFVWVAALLAGVASDLTFMALPLVDNFWHAQAMVMLTPRLPAYILCVYVCFLYIPWIAARRLGVGRAATAAAAGLLAMLFYAPYDIVGARYLWWTWHDTDPGIAHRLFGAPMGSTLWVLVFAASFAALVDVAVRRWTAPSGAGWLAPCLFVAVLSTPAMMLVMAALQTLDGGVPGPIALGSAATVAVIVAACGLRGRRSATAAPLVRPLAVGVVAHLVALLIAGLAFDPTTHRSASLHQTLGDCDVVGSDITGHTRHVFLCATHYDEPFDLRCGGTAPPDGASWYAVCGRTHGDRGRWLAGLGAFVISAAALLGAALRGGTPMDRRNSS